MLTVYLNGHNREYMEKFVDFVNEALIGWGPLIRDEFTISDPHEFEDGEVAVKITMGNDSDEDGDEHVLDLNYDDMFMPKEHVAQTRVKWML